MQSRTFLPADCARCWSKYCPLKDTCIRNIDKANGSWATDFKSESKDGKTFRDGYIEYKIINQ